MEGIANEACSLAGHWGLGKLIAFYDDNHISIDGDTEIAFTESVDTRFEGLGWHVIWVKNGNTGYDEIRAAIKEAKAVKDKPTLIKVPLLNLMECELYLFMRGLQSLKLLYPWACGPCLSKEAKSSPWEWTFRKYSL